MAEPPVMNIHTPTASSPLVRPSNYRPTTRLTLQNTLGLTLLQVYSNSGAPGDVVRRTQS